ncbi:MAG TPA: TrmH family RNA methyltransferase [Candidatus Saccharimonadaceae bacterium]|nr:TrmH family RNA methyltransferase [Candidatus Saccharimonadaceae bacterium]
MPDIILITHNIRSTHNVGSLFRTADGFGVSRIILSGYTPYPTIADDTRLPHIRDKLTRQIHKTALGAEQIVPFEYADLPPLPSLKKDGYRIVALEQDARSTSLASYSAPEKVALVIGEEVDGIAAELLEQCDDIIEIPMVGKKESFNVSVATGIALYQLTT